MNPEISLSQRGRVAWTLAMDESWLVSIGEQLFVVHDGQVAARLQDGSLVEYQFAEVGRQKVITQARVLEPRRETPIPEGPVTGASLLAAAILVAPMELAPADAVETTAKLARRLGAVLGASA